MVFPRYTTNLAPFPDVALVPVDFQPSQDGPSPPVQYPFVAPFAALNLHLELFSPCHLPPLAPAFPATFLILPPDAEPARPPEPALALPPDLYAELPLPPAVTLIPLQLIFPLLNVKDIVCPSFNKNCDSAYPPQPPLPPPAASSYPSYPDVLSFL